MSKAIFSATIIFGLIGTFMYWGITHPSFMDIKNLYVVLVTINTH
jgi:hypothetical protein